MTYIKENIITKLQKFYSPAKNPKADNKSHVLFLKKPLCMGDLSPTRKIFIERSGLSEYQFQVVLNFIQTAINHI